MKMNVDAVYVPFVISTVTSIYFVYRKFVDLKKYNLPYRTNL